MGVQIGGLEKLTVTFVCTTKQIVCPNDLHCEFSKARTYLLLSKIDFSVDAEFIQSYQI